MAKLMWVIMVGILVVAVSGQFDNFKFMAKTKAGQMCERHLQLQSCLGKAPADCRKCAKKMTSRCGKLTLKNLCHMHFAGETTKKPTPAPQSSSLQDVGSTVAKIMQIAQPNTNDDDQAPVTIRTSRDTIVHKLQKMESKLEAHIALVKHKADRKAQKIALGLKANPAATPKPTATPTIYPTKAAALNYAKSVKTATNKAMGIASQSEGSQIWDEVDKENENEAKKDTESTNGIDNTITTAASSTDTPVTNTENSGESMCEEHGYNKKQCATVGCCTFLSGLCWSAVGVKACTGAPDFLKKKTPAPTQVITSHSHARITKHALASTPSPAAKLTGEIACEEHGYTETQCGAVGCCTFMSGLCWSAVGKRLCSHGAHHKAAVSGKSHDLQHPLANSAKSRSKKTHKHHKHKHKHPHIHSKTTQSNGPVTATPYPTPHPTVITTSPTLSPTKVDRETKEEKESAIEDRIFGGTTVDDSKGSSSHKILAITPAPTMSSGVKSVAAIRTKMAAIQGLTKETACTYLENQATKTCKYLKGRGTLCAKGCDKLMTHMKSARPYLTVCDFQWKKKTHKEICWPSDCTPTVHFFCAPYMHSVIQGHDKNGAPVYYDVCQLCMLHYIWMTPPIPGSGCWQEKLEAGTCPSSYRNLPKGRSVVSLSMKNLKQALKTIPEKNLPSFRAK